MVVLVEVEVAVVAVEAEVVAVEAGVETSPLIQKQNKIANSLLGG